MVNANASTAVMIARIILPFMALDSVTDVNVWKNYEK